MKLLLITLALMTPLFAYSQNTDLGEIGRIIDSWGQASNHEHNEQCEDQPSSLQRPQCPLTLQPFCELSTGICRRDTGNAACMETRPAEVQRRVRGGLRNARANLNRRFNELKSNRELENHCCGNSGSECWFSFRRTRLEVLPDNHPSLQGSRAHFDSNPDIFNSGTVVRISESRLAQAKSLEDLDYLLFHELGHACQMSLAIANNKKSEWRENNNRNIQNYVGFERVHPAVSRCIQQKINSTNTSSADLTVWKHEIFADTIFSKFRNHSRHWAYSCARLSSPSTRHHPSSELYLECNLLDPVVQNNFCQNR